jgi:hypothetical protein
MARSAKVSLDWADGEYDFKLGIGELEELEEKTRRRGESGEYVYIGPMRMFELLTKTGDWLVRDVRETIRLGLIGGGTKPTDALRLVRRYVDDVPDWNTNCLLAANIIAAALSGWDDEPLGKPAGAKTVTEAEMDASPSPHSMPTQP